MPFDAGDFGWQGRPAPDPERWEALNNILHRLALYVARGVLFSIVLLYVAYTTALVTGGGPGCIGHGFLFDVCR